jgi:hypothetical protein
MDSVKKIEKTWWSVVEGDLFVVDRWQLIGRSIKKLFVHES